MGLVSGIEPSLGRLLTVGMTCVLAAALLLIPTPLPRLESLRAGPGRSDRGSGDAGAA